MPRPRRVRTLSGGTAILTGMSRAELDLITARILGTKLKDVSAVFVDKAISITEKDGKYHFVVVAYDMSTKEAQVVEVKVFADKYDAVTHFKMMADKLGLV